MNNNSVKGNISAQVREAFRRGVPVPVKPRATAVAPELRRGEHPLPPVRPRGTIPAC